MANRDRTAPQPSAGLLVAVSGRDDCCQARQRQERTGTTVAVGGFGGVMVLCCAGPALLLPACSPPEPVPVRSASLRFSSAFATSDTYGLIGRSVAAVNSSDDSAGSRDGC